MYAAEYLLKSVTSLYDQYRLSYLYTVTWISHITYELMQQSPQESRSYTNIRQTNPSDTQSSILHNKPSSILHNKPNYDRLYSTLLVPNPYHHKNLYMCGDSVSSDTRQPTNPKNTKAPFTRSPNLTLSLPFSLTIPSTVSTKQVPLLTNSQ